MSTVLRRAATAGVLALAVAVVPAAAAPADFANPDVEGSAVDYRNALAAASSDTTAAGAGVTLDGCTATAERPRSHPSTTSPTRREVRSQVFLHCAVAYNVEQTFALQRSRWYGWTTMSSLTLRASGSPAFATGTLVGPCYGGVWHYRVVAEGRATFRTQSSREACNRLDDPFTIEG